MQFGRKRLGLYGKDPNFNMLITDMVMPGMTGAQLTKIIKDKLPEIKVILASGYSEEIVRQELDNLMILTSSPNPIASAT